MPNKELDAIIATLEKSLAIHESTNERFTYLMKEVNDLEQRVRELEKRNEN